MNIPTLKLASAVALALGTQLGGTLAHAATPLTGDILTITSGVGNYDTNGNFVNVGSGSWFGMDSNGNSSIAGTEQTLITAAGTAGGLVFGTAQNATGSHTGVIDGSETPAFDIWEYFGNTGMHFTRSAPTGSTTAGLDFSGWAVTWNGIPTIDMSTGAWQPGNCAQAFMGCTGITFTNGNAYFAWDGTYGNAYTLWYTATVPVGDPSGFGGVKYIVKLTGTVLSGNSAPVATDFTVATPVDTPLNIDLTTRVSDADGNGTIDWPTLSINCDSGTPTDDNAGLVTFTPDVGTENTTATCTYNVQDTVGDVSNNGTLSVNIQTAGAVNTPPTAAGDTLNVANGGSVNWTPAVSDADNDTLSCSIAPGDEPANGTVSFTAGCASGTYTHDGSATTTDSFIFTVSDGTDTATATVDVNIAAAVNVAPVATNFTASAVGTTPVNINFTSRVTDSDGTVDWTTLNVTCTNGTTTDNNAGIVTYTAPANFTGADSCSYSVSDNDGDVSNIATLTVNVSAAATGGVLPNGTVVLQLTAGNQLLNPDGSKLDVDSGSWFGMDTDGNSRMAGSEKTPLQAGPDDGLIMGALQTATGSHSGAPNGSENASVDAPWNFFGNTGMHYTASTAPTPISGDTANGINLSGWRVTWNSIPAINMGTGAWTPGNCATLNITTCSFSNGVAQFSWNDVDASGGISDGDTYRLIYAATVPVGDPSGFGGVRYLLNLEGTIAVIPGPIAGAGATLEDGDLGGTDANGYRPTRTLPADANYSNVGGYYDYKVNCGGAGCSADVYIPLSSPIPAGALLRKYGVTPGNPAGGWDTFDTSGGDSIASADSATGGGDCSAAVYSAGLTAGHDCLRVTQTEGGLNDTDGTANDGIIGDPSGIAVPVAAPVTSDLSSGSSGCTLSNRPVSISAAGDWLLVGATLAGLGLLRRRVF